MSIAELFESGERKSQKGAFRNLVLMARADGILDASEREMLNRMARRLDLDEAQVEQIMANPEAYPIHPPINVDDRRERMVDLVRMMMVDGEIDSDELSTLQRCAVGLGYQTEDIPEMVHKIRHHLNAGKDRTAVIEAMLSEG